MVMAMYQFAAHIMGQTVHLYFMVDSDLLLIYWPFVDVSSALHISCLC